jgi:hypothetical protein
MEETYLSCGRVKIYLRDGIFLKSIAGRRREEEAKKISQGIHRGDLACIFGLRISRRIIPLCWIWLIHVGSSIREQRERVGIGLRVRRVERVACELAPEFEVTSWGRNVAFGGDRGVVAWGGGDLEGGLVVSKSGRREEGHGGTATRLTWRASFDAEAATWTDGVVWSYATLFCAVDGG